MKKARAWRVWLCALVWAISTGAASEGLLFDGACGDFLRLGQQSASLMGLEDRDWARWRGRLEADQEPATAPPPRTGKATAQAPAWGAPRFACQQGLQDDALAGPQVLGAVAHGLQAITTQAPKQVPVQPLLRWQACAAGLAQACAGACPAPSADAAQVAQVRAVLASLPDPGLRQLLEPLLLAVAQAHEAVVARMPPGLAPPQAGRAWLADLLAWLRPLDAPAQGQRRDESAWLDDWGRWLRAWDAGAMACDAVWLAQAVEDAVQGLRDAQATGALTRLRWQAQTPWGAVVLDTREHDGVYRLRDEALVVDVGGDDEYRFEAASVGRPVAVLLDLAGDDRYVSLAPGAGPAVALMGHHLVWDGAGDDQYDSRGQALGQAAAVLGVALLVDESGRDVYRADVAAQGWALGGLALLADGAGDDVYHALALAQGSAQPGGVALLADLAGDDRYVLAGQPLVLPSAQLPQRNVSMGQGAGTGWWLPARPQASLPGGVGVLFDAAGDDRYQAEVFAQGAGYYMGTGVLVDGGGSDTLRGAWYVMGAGAHLGQGLMLQRGAGRDTLRASHVSALGMGHDQGLGVLLHETGAAVFESGGLGMGAGHEGGTGLMLVLAGGNRFERHGSDCRALGAAAWPPDYVPGPDEAPTRGLFVARGGGNRYTLPPSGECAGVAAGQRWRWGRDGRLGQAGVQPPEAGQRGLGMDEGNDEP